MQHKWKVRFGVGTLLFLMVVFAGYFYGLNWGVETRRNNSLSTRVYSVARIVSSDRPVDRPVDRQIDSIMQLIYQTIEPDSWYSSGGAASILPYPANRSIAVTQYTSAHAKIEDLLQDLTKVAEDEVCSIEYECSSILNRSGDKPTREQLEAIAGQVNQRFGRSGNASELIAGPIEITINLEQEAVVIRTRSEMHSALEHYFEKLRFARQAIAEIDR